MPFRPDMLVEQYDKEYYQYTPNDIINLSNGLHKAITEYFPNRNEQPGNQNILHMVNRWNTQEKSDIYDSVKEVKTQVDKLYNILNKSITPTK